MASSMTDYFRNTLIDAVFRNTVPVLWTANTIYAAGTLVWVDASPYRQVVFEAQASGTTGPTVPTFNTSLGALTADNSVTWITCFFGVPKRMIYIALCSNDANVDSAPIELTADSYRRVAKTPIAGTNWASTQGTADPVSTSNTGTTYNRTSIVFPTPTEDWGSINSFAIYSTSAVGTGQALFWKNLLLPQTVLFNDPAPMFDPQTLTIQFDTLFPLVLS